MNLFIYIYYTLSDLWIRCIAADILWQPSNLPCLDTFSSVCSKALQSASLP